MVGWRATRPVLSARPLALRLARRDATGVVPILAHAAATPGSAVSFPERFAPTHEAAPNPTCRRVELIPANRPQSMRPPPPASGFCLSLSFHGLVLRCL